MTNLDNYSKISDLLAPDNIMILNASIKLDINALIKLKNHIDSELTKYMLNLEYDLNRCKEVILNNK